MNGNWSGGLVPNAMLGWGQPRPLMLPFLPQMPQAIVEFQNIQVPGPGQGLLPDTSTSIHPGPPSLAPSHPLSSVHSFPTNLIPSATSFQLGPPTSFPARAPSTASTSSFPSGPPSVASFPKAGNTVPRAWLQSKPNMVDSVCGDSFAVEKSERKSRKLSPSRDVARELVEEESPASQPPPPHVCRLCAALVGRELTERLVSKKQAPVREPSLPNSRSPESGDASLPPPPTTTQPPTTPPPTTPRASIPSTSAGAVTTADPPPASAPSTSKFPKKEEVGKKGAKLGKRVKGTKVSQDSGEALLTSGTKSFPSEDHAEVPTTPTTPFLKRENVSGAQICPHCGISYSTSALLDKHVHLCRQRPKEFPCPKCSSSFGAKSTLKTHVETVHYPPKHQCHICGKWFSQKSNCTQHMRSQHSNSNPFKCSLCDFSTLHKNSLTAHMSTHSSQKPFACPLCSASFCHNPRLNGHLNKAHSPGQSPLLCPHCGWAFAIKCHLSKHINSLHKES